jgi:hypothetical protein
MEAQILLFMPKFELIKNNKNPTLKGIESNKKTERGFSV